LETADTFSHNGATSMLAFLILIAAAFSRLLPHALHGVGLNFTAVGAGLLFFGSRRPRREAVIATAVMAITDVYLTTHVYGLPFHVSGYVITWLWYAAVVLMGASLLRKVTVLRVIAGVFASATSFFLISNFMVWLGSGMYAHTVASLMMCYRLAVPFYANDLASTGIVSAAVFGLPVLAAKLAESMQENSHHTAA
jgi:hypothetical protein